MAQLPDHISASWVELFMQCPIAYRIKYIDKLSTFTGNIYTAFWKAIHYALETNFRQKITTRADLPLKEVLIPFNEFLDKELKELWENNTDAIEIIRMQWEEMLYQYLQTIAPHIQPASVEMKFEIDLKSIGWKILWYIDLITEDDLIIDHKTAGATTYQKRTQCYVDRMVQLTMYSLAFRKTYNRIEKGNRIDVLKRLKGSIWFNHVESKRDDQDILNLVNLLSKMKTIIEQDLWYPNFSSCSDCEMSSICNRK
jgi:hypothetical protein